MSKSPDERQIERIASQSPDFRAELREQLRAVVPEAFAEGKLDADKLKALLGEGGDAGPERYSFSWAGKRDAIAMLQAPTRATLIPDREHSVNFDEAQHVFIEGENLEVLKVLYRSYFGRVKMIYIDPPYNTGNDFIYPDDFADPLDNYLRITGQKNGNGDYTTSQVDTSGRIHSAWLSMMYPRLVLARQLLRDDGVIFVSIDDHEVANLRALMDEIFGEENLLASIIWQKMDSPSRNDEARYLTNYHDYIIAYARNSDSVALKQKAKPEILKAYPIKWADGRLARRRQFRKNGKEARREDRPTLWFDLTAPDGTQVWPVAPEGWEGRWAATKATWDEREKAGLTEWIKRDYGWVPYTIEFAPNSPSVPWPTIWTDVDQNRQAKAEFTALMGSNVEFDNPKPSALVKQLLRMSTSGEDIVFDFFVGSGTTAQAVLDLNHEDGSNRRFVVVQLPEKTVQGERAQQLKTIADIARMRIKKAIDRIKAGNGERDPDEAEGPENLNFRAMSLYTTSFRSWSGVADKDASVVVQQIEVFSDSLVPGWKSENVIWEVALREGYSLTSRIEKIDNTGTQTFWRVTDPDREQSFIICLDSALTLETVRALKLPKNALFVCRDTALDDTLSANLALQCRLKVL